MPQLLGCFSEKVIVIPLGNHCVFGLIKLAGRAEERVAKLVDSPDRPESEASYKLDEGGWADV